MYQNIRSAGSLRVAGLAIVSGLIFTASDERRGAGLLAIAVGVAALVVGMLARRTKPDGRRK